MSKLVLSLPVAALAVVLISLPVMGEIDAGARTPSRLQPKQAARVQTGAPMPTLADAVLPLRWTDGGQARVRVLALRPAAGGRLGSPTGTGTMGGVLSPAVENLVAQLTRLPGVGPGGTEYQS